MADKSEMIYIVYNKKTNIIVNRFPYYSKDLENCVKQDSNLAWLNSTHPKNKELLEKLKEPSE